MPIPNECLTPGCIAKGLPNYRGLCLKHYSTAKKLVESGKTTWEELEKMDLVGEGQDLFLDAFNKRKPR